MNDAVEKFYPGRSEYKTDCFIKMVENFQNFDFLSFNELKTIHELYQPDFDQVNLTEVALFVRFLRYYHLINYLICFSFEAFSGM